MPAVFACAYCVRMMMLIVSTHQASRCVGV